MLSKEERKQKNQAFWEGFKSYMKGTPSCSGKRTNWLNYPTQVEELYVRLNASNNGCSLNFDIQSKDEGVREIIWEQMGELRVVLASEMNFPSIWHDDIALPNGQIISRITWENNNLNYFNQDDQEAIYAFLKQRLIDFDRFYEEYKDILIALVD